jgi:hypothetical protein
VKIRAEGNNMLLKELAPLYLHLSAFGKVQIHVQRCQIHVSFVQKENLHHQLYRSGDEFVRIGLIATEKPLEVGCWDYSCPM